MLITLAIAVFILSLSVSTYNVADSTDNMNMPHKIEFVVYQYTLSRNFVSPSFTALIRSA